MNKLAQSDKEISLEGLSQYEQQRILKDEADRLLRQAGIEPQTGRPRSQLPKNYSHQRYFENHVGFPSGKYPPVTFDFVQPRR